jgi:predicted nucleic acid-binding Zn ribbon protein
MQHARSTLKKIFADTIRREGGGAPLLAWPLACGSKTAERASAISFADGVLTVCVSDEGWRRQLQSMAPQYLAALNQISPQPVSKIVFVSTSRTDG